MAMKEFGTERQENLAVTHRLTDGALGARIFIL